MRSMNRVGRLICLPLGALLALVLVDGSRRYPARAAASHATSH